MVLTSRPSDIRSNPLLLALAMFDPVVAGFFIAVGLTVLLVVLLSFPLATPEPLEGRVVEMGFGVGRRVTQPRAMVSAGGKLYLVGIEYSDGCSVGDRIKLQRTRRLWGSFVMADVAACLWPNRAR